MPSHYTHGEDYLDHEKKKKFNYKEAKAKLDAQKAAYEKGSKEAREKDRIRNEKKKREADAKKWVEEENRKRLERHGFKPKETKAVYISKGKASRKKKK
tara:strand:+ start:222 stop:518 length:297 start_codon:yes stop_codon:yes gene_type:complete